MHTQKNGFSFKYKWELVCLWVDSESGSNKEIKVDIKRMFADLLRVFGSLSGVPFKNAVALRLFLQSVSKKQGKGEYLDGWLVKHNLESQHKLPPSVLTIFTFVRPGSQLKKKV